MMFSDEEIKESSLMRPGDEIISIREVYLSDKYDKKELGFGSEALLSASGRNDLEAPRSFFRDGGFFPEGPEQQQARFAWTEEDGTIAALVSEPGFGTTGTSFGKDLDIALKTELKEADTSSTIFEYSNRNGMVFTRKPYVEQQTVTSTSSSSSKDASTDRGKASKAACKVDKTDPRSRFHYVKYLKRHGRTVKLWECGICSREFQHQYTLMRHLPTHTDERNFHCDACAKSFRQLSTLSQHRAIHSAERPYKCEVCTKTFNRVSTLISHRKTHSDEKPYKCHICPKGFHQKGNLRNHLFTHTNERPYRCNICMKGFNQQSNLVCHKNKAHPDESDPNNVPKRRINAPRNNVRQPADSQAETSRQQSEQCEVTSSMGPYLPPTGTPGTWAKPADWEMPKPFPEPGDPWGGEWGAIGTGVIVDAIKTYHMGIALATRQTPFALLKSDSGAPVLVKVVDTSLPGGKQMLVPATAEDLRVGGKIVLKDDESPADEVDPPSAVGGAVQIRVPVVATVVPRIRPGGRLHLAVEEPHHTYHTAVSTEMGAVKLEPCTINTEATARPPAMGLEAMGSLERPETSRYNQQELHADGGMAPACSLPPPPPSPPLDLIAMDLFEPMEGIPMGPQITAVDSVDHGPSSDESDIFIGKFEEGIPLSDSD